MTTPDVLSPLRVFRDLVLLVIVSCTLIVHGGRMRFRKLLATTLLCMWPTLASADIDAGSDGLSGVLNVTGTPPPIDLALALTGTVGDNNNPAGIYDPDQWVVLFEYTDVIINPGATLNFLNHPSGAPVVWLVSGDVVIHGTLGLDGSSGNTSPATGAAGGPGGFHGGHKIISASSPAGAGRGPGGGRRNNANNGAGGYGTPGGGSVGFGGVTYGNEAIIPLIGGSGAAANDGGSLCSGCGGGGAILIVCDNTIVVNGTVSVNGGAILCGSTNGASGGAIRLVADEVAIGATGTLRANGSSSGFRQGGFGRIRLEANTLTILGAVSPSPSPKSPLGPSDPVIWPPTNTPEITIVAVAGVPVPVDPRAEMDTPPGDVNIDAAPPVLVDLQTGNVPTNSTVILRVVPRQGESSPGPPYEVTATLMGGNEAIATWQASLTSIPPAGFAALQARVVLP